MDKTYIHLQVLTALKEQLEEEAKQKGLSLNAYLITILLERKQ